MTETPRTLRIATRGSRLALWQAEFVQAQLKSHGYESELVLIETQGDREQDVAFSQMQGQGFFTKAVQDAVLDTRADLAVHSLKDLPSARCPGLSLAAIPQRVDPRDSLLVRPGAHHPEGTWFPLAQGAIVGTSAARRRAQIEHARPDLEIKLLRGNVPTRIQKLRDGAYDAILLAAAGIQRLALDVSDLEVHSLPPETFVPAPGQGALAIECRENDEEVVTALRAIHDAKAAQEIELERTLMARFEGGCQLALGANARFLEEQSEWELLAWYKGKQLTLAHADPEALSQQAYDALK